MLPPAVRALLGGAVESREPLVHNEGNAATGGLWRVRGPAGTAVLKVARPPAAHPARSSWPTSAAPTHWNFWRREVLAYTSGLNRTAYADAGIVAPALLDAAGRPDGAVELWLADARGAPGMSWPVERLAATARQLGVAQAGWLDRVPALPWLSRRWLRQYLAEGPGRNVRDGQWDHPVAAAWPPPVRAALRRLWHDRDRVRAAAEALPRTLCHLDVWPNNLIADGATTVLLDWSFAGEGGIGEDPANLIVDSVADGLMDMGLLPDIVAGVTGGYLAGLRAGGWSGPDAVVVRSVAVGAVAKYCWFAPLALGRVVRDGTFGHPQYGRDASGEAALRRLAPLVTQLAAWAELV